MANKEKKNKDSRLTFEFEEFFVDKLFFDGKKILFGTNVKFYELLKILDKKEQEVMKKSGLKITGNAILTDEQIAEIAMMYNFDFKKVADVSEENVLSNIIELVQKKEWNSKADIQEKTPVITIMGHVDHGKTSLLDVLRKSNLTSKEIGGITQTIGAYQIESRGKKITFVDTPGHEAFTEMRSNGSQITDIAVIVVAADDSIMPQTKESIDHAKAAKIPIIVAINKIDTPGANVEQVMSDLSDYGVMPEEWGGDVPFVQVSALKKENIDELINTILLQSEMLEMKTPVNINGVGVVIESNVDKQRGNLVSILVQHGTLKVGDQIIIDDILTKVKSMKDDMGRQIKEASSGMPVELFGIGSAPAVGAKFAVVSNYKEAKKIAETIKEVKLNRSRKIKELSPEELFAQFANKKKESINIILKTDSLGSQEAIATKIESMRTKDVNVKIIRKSIGEITNTDVQLASASDAEILAFNVKAQNQLETLIREKQVLVQTYNIIYKLLEDLDSRINVMGDPVYETNKTGEVLVQAVFSFSKVGNIAGFIVREGEILRHAIAKVIRNGEEIFEGSITTLKTGKDDTKSRSKGQEGGLTIEKFDAFQEGDVIESWEKVLVS